jgi:hypothetical protein
MTLATAVYAIALSSDASEVASVVETGIDVARGLAAAGGFVVFSG